MPEAAALPSMLACFVRPHITTQEQFKEVHVSYFLERKYGNTTKEERKAAKEERKAAKWEAHSGAIYTKRAKLLDELIDAIPMQQLQRAFQNPIERDLRKLQVKHGFKQSNTTTYKELKELFAERY